MSLKTIAAMIIVRNARNAGQSVKEISRLAGVSKSTVYRWLKATGR